MKKLLMIVLLGSLAFTQSISKVGTSSAKFLNVPVDAWGTGRGQAVVTGFDDAATLYWNPSTIALIDKSTAHFSYTNWFEDINFNYISAVVPFGSSVFAVNTTFYQTDPMEVTTELYQDGTGEYFTVGSQAIGLAYARRLTDNFAIGANAKYVSENIYNSSATGVAVDIGGRYLTPWQGIVLGFAITNFGTKMQMSGEDLTVTVDPDPTNSGNNDVINAYYSTDKFDMPLAMTIGLAWEFLNSDLTKATIEVDGIYPSDNFSRVNAGIDMSFFNDLVFFRAGAANLFLDEMKPLFSVGGGLNYPILGNLDLCVNYAYQTHEYFDKNEHVSLSIRF